jgi:hypothetical protein
MSTNYVSEVFSFAKTVTAQTCVMFPANLSRSCVIPYSCRIHWLALYCFHFSPLYRHWDSVQAVQPVEGVEVQLYSFMTTAPEGGEWSASRPGRSLPPGKTRYPLYRRLGGPQSQSGQVRKISPPPGFDPRTVQLVASRYTDWAVRPTYCSNKIY